MSFDFFFDFEAISTLLVVLKIAGDILTLWRYLTWEDYFDKILQAYSGGLEEFSSGKSARTHSKILELKNSKPFIS